MVLDRIKPRGGEPPAPNHAGPEKPEKWRALMEVLRTLYYGRIKENKSFVTYLTVSLTCLLVALLLSFFIKMAIADGVKPSSLIWLVIYIVGLGFIGISILPYPLFRSLLAIRHFRKLFGFLPPTTPEGRNVYQSAVDKTLSLMANCFLGVCAEQDKLRKHLEDLAKSPQDPFSPQFDAKKVAITEELLRDIRQRIPVERRNFKKYQNAAGSQFLPAPFNICPSVKCYQELSPTGRAVCVCKEKKSRKGRPGPPGPIPPPKPWPTPTGN